MIIPIFVFSAIMIYVIVDTLTFKPKDKNKE